MKKTLLSLPIIALLIVGCGEKTVTTQDISTKAVTNTEVEKKTIITSFYPITFLTQEITGKSAEVVNLANALDVHDYEPSPRDMVKLHNADLVIFQGAELEPWTHDVIPELSEKGISTLEVSHDLTLAKMEEHEEHGDEHEEDHEDEDEHDEHEEEGHEDEHDEHNHGEFDPHTWLDPVLAQDMVDEILNAILAVDPAQKTVYETNAKSLKNRLASLDQNYQSTLASCSNTEVIAAHDAFGYIARRYDFEIHAIAGISTQDEPSAKVLAELKTEAEEGITHILVEESNVRRFADTLANETGLALLPINPLGRGTLDPNKDFFNVMEDNLNSFKIALNCQ